jgi:spermidine/putrescine transport system permease protein
MAKEGKGSFLTSWQGLFSIAMFLFMYLPILVLGVYSFNDSRYGAVWKGWSFHWYAKLFQDERLFGALMDSLQIASFAVGMSAVLGTLMAVGLSKYRFPGKSLFFGISVLPLIVPDIAIAVATLIFLATITIPLSIWTAIAAHTVFCLAYVAIVVSSRLKGLDPHLEEAALDLGANPTQALIKVLLPQLGPAILSGCLLAFVLSMDDLLISSFTAGGATPLPVEIYSRVRTGVKPDMNALGVVLILFSILLAGFSEYFRYKSDQMQG